jgi:hypothetical protein
MELSKILHIAKRKRKKYSENVNSKSYGTHKVAINGFIHEENHIIQSTHFFTMEVYAERNYGKII